MGGAPRVGAGPGAGYREALISPDLPYLNPVAQPWPATLEGTQPIGRLFGQGFHQSRSVGVFGEPDRLPGKQCRELPVARSPKRPRQAVLGGKCNRLEARSDE